MKRSFAAWCVFVFFFGVLTGTASALVDRPGYDDYRPPQKAQANGRFIVSVFRDGAWREAGDLAFDQFFRDRSLDLARPKDSGETIRVRLTQTGGGGAHIDSVFLGGAPPIGAPGNEKGLPFLQWKDFDVLDAFDKQIELVFPADVPDGQMVLTARVESPLLSKTPFQFPLSNLYRTIGPDSDFYAYPLSGDTSLKDTESVFGQMVKGAPLAKEYSPAGSGHPSEYTYIWAAHDRNFLYVVLEFTGDNTADGNKDYAKVLVRASKGGVVRSFRISRDETRWGDADFKYTDKTLYRHKVYRFRIPLAELGDPAGELNLAFAAYGTLAPPPPSGPAPPVTASVPPGTDASKFKIISVPVDVPDPSPTAVLGPVIGTYSTDQYRIGRWSPGLPGYQEYPDLAPFLPGHAYWFLASAGLDLTFTGNYAPTTLNPNANWSVRVVLDYGWNQVGNPFDYPILVNEIMVKDIGTGNDEYLTASTPTITQGIFWMFDQGSYSPGSVIPVAVGGWIKKIVSGPGWVYFRASGVPMAAADQQESLDLNQSVPDYVERPPAPPGFSGGGGGDGGGGGGGCFITAGMDD